MNAETLQAMARPNLQDLARRYNVRANLKSVAIIKQLLDRFPDGIPQLYSQIEGGVNGAVVNAAAPVPAQEVHRASNPPPLPSVAQPITSPIPPRESRNVAPAPGRANTQPTGRQRLSNSSMQQAPEGSRHQAPHSPHHVAPAQQTSPANVAVPTPGPHVSHNPPTFPQQPPPRLRRRSTSMASNLSIQSVDLAEAQAAPPEPASITMLERAVRGMDNLISNHEEYYREIMKRRRVVRQLRLKARTARSLIAQEAAIHERLTTMLSYFRQVGPEWAERDVYGSMCRVKQLRDGTREEITSEDERQEANAQAVAAGAPPTLKADDAPPHPSPAPADEPAPIVEMPAWEAYNIELPPEPTRPRKKRSRPPTVDIDSQDTRALKRNRPGPSKFVPPPLKSALHKPAPPRATAPSPPNHNPNPLVNNESDEFVDSAVVLSMLQSEPGSGSSSSKSTSSRGCYDDLMQSTAGGEEGEGSSGETRSSSLSRRANFASSPPLVPLSSPTRETAQGEVDKGKGTENVWGGGLRDSGVDNSPPLGDLKGKQRANI